MEDLGPLIDDPALDPDPARTDWEPLRAKINELRARLDEMLRADPYRSDPEAMGTAALYAAEVGALQHASGARAEGLALLSAARELVAGGSLRALIEAGSLDPDGFTAVMRARWLQRHSRWGEAERLLRRAQKTLRDPALRAAAEAAYQSPRPIRSAPSLATLNGVGTGLYGDRDRRQDGSYIATYCICFLFMPIVPLSAYRVRRVDGRTYQFAGKVPLSPFARAARLAVPLAALLFIGGNAVSSYLNSPSRQLGRELAAIAERHSRPEEALDRYGKVIHDFQGRVGAGELAGAAGDMIELATQGVHEPFTAEQLAVVERIWRRYLDLPIDARHGAAGPGLARRLVAWADQVADRRVALRLLTLASAADASRANQSLTGKRRGEVTAALAGQVAADDPAEALRLALDARDARLGEEYARAVAASPSLLLESQEDVEAWLAAGAPGAEEVRAALEKARARRDDPARQAALDSRERPALQALARKQPDDQEVAVALAGLELRDKGDVAAFIARLSALGPPARLTTEARANLAEAYLHAGKLDEADALLAGFLAGRLPRFSEARTAYTTALDGKRKKLIEGPLPRSLESRLTAAAEQERPQIASEWLAGELDADRELTALKAAYLRHAPLVSAALTLADVKLRRAAAARGEAKGRLLHEAEELFVAMQAEGGGQASYHLGLGQVYHRLGRSEDGEKELRAAIDSGDGPALEAAAVYRELGLMNRAREVLEAIYGSSTASPAEKARAAAMRSALTDIPEEEETWLRRSDTALPYVRRTLLQAEGERLLREGKPAEADQAFAKVIAAYGREVEHDAPSANNVAMVLISRYRCSGDPAHLDKALAHMETAKRLEPANAILINHLADMYAARAALAVVERYVRVRALRLSASEVDTLLDGMRVGPEEKNVEAAYAAQPATRRALALVREAEVLAPQGREAYALEEELLLRSGDDAGLRQLAARLAELPPVDSSDTDKKWHDWAAGSLDGTLDRALSGRLGHYQRIEADVQKTGHKPTLAALRLLGGDALLQRAVMKGKLEDARATERLYAEADGLWKQSGAGGGRAAAALLQATIEVASSTPALAEVWGKGRAHNFTVYLARVAADPALVSALRADPRVVEAASLRRAEAGDKSMDWLLGVIAGDAELEKLAAAAFGRDDVRLQAEIDARLSPNLPDMKEWLALVQQHSAR